MPSSSSTPCLTEDELSALIAGQGSVELVGRMEQHIAGCRTCAEWLAASLRVVTGEGDAAEPDAETRLRDEDRADAPVAGDPLAALLPPGMSDAPPAIGRYVLEALLGIGGMGVV